METAEETKFSTKVAYWMRMTPKLWIEAWCRESTWYHTQWWK